jgi:hypothetical protein
VGGGAVKPMDIAIEFAGLVIRMTLTLYIIYQIDHEQVRTYEQAMAFAMIYLLINSDKGGKA